jgi:hypothetical protein
MPAFRHNSEATYQLINLRSFLSEPWGFHSTTLESKFEMQEGMVAEVLGKED